jgi:hypothetical protein
MKASGYLHASAALPPGKNLGIRLSGAGWAPEPVRKLFKVKFNFKVRKEVKGSKTIKESKWTECHC